MQSQINDSDDPKALAANNSASNPNPLITPTIEALRRSLKTSTENQKIDREYQWDLAKVDGKSVVIPSTDGSHSLRLTTTADVSSRCRGSKACYTHHRSTHPRGKSKSDQIVMSFEKGYEIDHRMYLAQCGIKARPGVSAQHLLDAMTAMTFVHERTHMKEWQTGKTHEHTAFLAGLESLYQAGVIEKPEVKNVLRASIVYSPKIYANAYHWAEKQAPTEDFKDFLPYKTEYKARNFSALSVVSPEKFKKIFYKELRTLYLNDLDKNMSKQDMKKAREEIDQKIRALQG